MSNPLPMPGPLAAQKLTAFINQLEAAVEKKKGRKKLFHYAPYPKQMQFHAAGATFRERLFRAGNQLGKAQPTDEPVLTPSGWRAIGDLQPGDAVIAGDGTITRVSGVFPQGSRPVFRLLFDDGASTRCCLEHLWRCRLGKRERFGAARDGEAWSVRSLGEIIAHGGLEPEPIKRAVIPHPGIAMLESKPVPLDPYLLGALIGDGCLKYYVSLSTADDEIKTMVAQALPKGVKLVQKGASYNYNIVGMPGRCAKTGHFTACNPVLTALRKLKLHGKGSQHKFVPKEYLWNSAEVRLAVLQGLMDTDGSACKFGGIEFSTTSPQLVEDVAFLVRSFGGKAKGYWRQTYAVQGETRKPGLPSYRMRIRLPHVPVFRLSRKLERVKRPVSTCDGRVLYRIVPEGEAECVCISVEHPSQTYITRDFIVTHNTYAAGAEMAFHLSGLYPEAGQFYYPETLDDGRPHPLAGEDIWPNGWQGRRWNRPITAWVGGPSGELVRDGPQRMLLGRPDSLGTGMIPGDLLGKPVAGRGVADLVDYVQVRHKAGGVSGVKFKTYDQGRIRWQAETIDAVWFDEEPPQPIYIEGLTRTNATKGMVYLSFTPLLGMSEVVSQFLVEPSADRSDTNMTIDDALHIEPEERTRIINSYPVHERDARISGAPMLGSGRIYPVAESALRCEPFPIPRHWRQICAIDFGWDHPTAAVQLAWDMEADRLYVIKTYRVKETTPILHAAALKPWGAWLPWMWPSDGLAHGRDGTTPLAKQYRDQGLNLAAEAVRWADGSNSVEPGLLDLLDRMISDRFKVFATELEWFEEFRLYHRVEGKITKLKDDLMDATRYALMGLRFATTPPNPASLANRAKYYG